MRQPTTERREAMFCQAGFDQWLATIMQHLSHLSKPQATVLALWSFGMVLARSCALTAVSHLLAKGLRRKEQTVRQQLRGSSEIGVSLIFSAQRTNFGQSG